MSDEIKIRCGVYNISARVAHPSEEGAAIRSGYVEGPDSDLLNALVAYFQIVEGKVTWQIAQGRCLQSAALIEIVTKTEEWFCSDAYMKVADDVRRARIEWLQKELQKELGAFNTPVARNLAKFDALKALYEKQRVEGISSGAFHDQSIGAITGWRWCNRPSKAAPDGHLWHVSYNSALKLHELPLPKSAEGIVNCACSSCVSFFAEGGK